MAKKPHKIFLADTFTATEWDTAETKLHFANQLLNFITADFPEAKFSKVFYNRLSMSFGFIAHYSVTGFFDTYFTSTRGKIRFLTNLLNWACFGDAKYTYCDVERAVQEKVREYAFLQQYQARLGRETEAAERALLANLQSKYGTTGSTGPSSLPPPVTPQTTSPALILVAPKPPQTEPSIQLALFAA